jgi:hypothetical protein
MSQARTEVGRRCPRCTLVVRPRFAMNPPRTCPRCLAVAHVHVRLQRLLEPPMLAAAPLDRQ